MENLQLYIKRIEVIKQIYSFRTLIYDGKIMVLWQKTMVLWEKKIWHYNENYGTLIYYIWKKLCYYGKNYCTIVDYSKLQ